MNFSIIQLFNFKFRIFLSRVYMAVICSLYIFFNLLKIKFNLLRTLILRGICMVFRQVFLWLINQKHNTPFLFLTFCYDSNCYLGLFPNNTPINSFLNIGLTVFLLRLAIKYISEFYSGAKQPPLGGVPPFSLVGRRVLMNFAELSLIRFLMYLATPDISQRERDKFIAVPVKNSVSLHTQARTRFFIINSRSECQSLMFYNQRRTLKTQVNKDLSLVV